MTRARCRMPGCCRCSPRPARAAAGRAGGADGGGGRRAGACSAWRSRLSASAAGAWCAAVGLPQLGVARGGRGPGSRPPAAGPRIRHVRWPQVVASLLDGCELVLLRPPGRPSAQVRTRLAATLRRCGGVLVAAGGWDGAQARLLVARQNGRGSGTGHGRLRARRVQVVADGRGAAARSRTRWLWLPGPGRLGGRQRTRRHRPGAGPAGHRVTAGGACPNGSGRLVPGWPDAGRETGTAGGDAARAVGGPGAGQRRTGFGPVVSVVEGFCPRVEVLRPGACAVGVRGPARYFGGEGVLAAKIIDAVAGGGVACSGGCRRRPFRRAPRGRHARLPGAPGRPPAPAASPVPRRGHVGGPRPGPGVPGPVPGQRAGQPRRRGSGGPSPPAGHRDAGGVRLAAQPADGG